MSGNYDRLTKAVISTAKKNILRGYRRGYIPGWDNRHEQLYQAYMDSGANKHRPEKFENTQFLDLKKSSRERWILLRKLGDINTVQNPSRHTTYHTKEVKNNAANTPTNSQFSKKFTNR